MTRAFFTLVGAGVAGGLIWVAAQVGGDTNGDFWARVGIVAGAGLALALARLPDVGVRTLSPSLPTFGLAFLPALVAAGWVIVGSQPRPDTYRGHVLAWSHDMGVTRVVHDLGPYAIVLAFGLGVLLGLVFERRVVDVVPEEPVATERADEPLYPPETPVDETTSDRELTRV
jgi:hypothetical protein